MSFKAAFDHTLGKERGYSNAPKDRGGMTRWGITEKTARDWGYTGAMADLPVAIARTIAYDKYWAPLKLDRICALSAPIAVEVFDTGYNMGQSTAARFLQRGLNVLNREQKMFPDLSVDGVLGLKTIDALERFLSARGKEGEKVLLRVLNSLQCAMYVAIAEKDASQEIFVYGWILQRVEI